MFTRHDEISQDTFVGAGLPSPYVPWRTRHFCRAGLPSPTFPGACANNYGFYYKTIQSRWTMKLDLMRKQSQTSYEKTLHLQQKKMCKNGKLPINPYSNKVYNHFKKLPKKEKSFLLVTF